MLQVGRGLDLGQEALGPDDRSQFRFQNLQRDLPLVAQIVSQVDRRHPALTELAPSLPTYVRHGARKELE